MKAIIYARTSSKSNRSLDNDYLSQEEKRDVSGKISLQLQERECRALADKLGFAVAAVYSDNGRSCVTYPSGFEDAARTDDEWQATIDMMKLRGIEFREGLGDLMKHISRGGIDAIIIRNETRLMRSIVLSKLLQTVYSFLKKYGVIIYTVEGRKIDARTFQDVFLANIVSMTEINGMMERLRNSASSLKEKQDSGWLISAVNNYGFRQVGKQRVELVPDEIREVKGMFESYLAGTSLRNICVDLMNRGIKTKHSAIWCSMSVRSILRSLRQTGYQLSTDGKYLPIQPFKEFQKELVPLEIWKRVQTRLDKNKDIGGRIRGVIHPLSRLLRCGRCGGTMTIYSGSAGFNDMTRVSYYVCKDAWLTHFKDDFELCRPIRIKERTTAIPNLDNPRRKKFLSTGLVDCLMPLLGLAVIVNLKESKHLDLQRGRIELIEEELASIAKTRKSLASRVAKGLITDNELDDMLADQNKRKQELDAEKSKQEAAINEAKRFGHLDLLKLTCDLSAGQLDLLLYRELAHKIFERINIFRDKIEVYLKEGFNETIIPGGIRKSKGGIIIIPRIKNHFMTQPFGKIIFSHDSVACVTYYGKTAMYSDDTTERILFTDGAFTVKMIGK